MIEYFNKIEFMCPCGCELQLIDEDFLEQLDRARKYAGIPFRINSGYRCPVYNEHKEYSSTSSHILGIAADISCTNSELRFKMLDALRKAGFKRIGIGQDFIHVDTDTTKAQKVIWMY